ncbi:MAG: hypothetical protein L6Q98_22810 [Anaerolineae bacterium]|nr:hypothetical protein [Anaerolineae bacterium]NUQ07037.1 hypothetical protein [Anaerolineae bacterium]
MTSSIPDISLDADWTCDYFEDIPTLYEFMETFRLPSLAKWTFDKTRRENWLAWLQKKFDLPMRDICVTYRLRIDSAPSPGRLTINGRDFGEIAAPLDLDVTDYVTLEDNLIAFRVPCEARGSFSDIRLTAFPCNPHSD